MYELINTFQDMELTSDELVSVAGGQQYSALGPTGYTGNGMYIGGSGMNIGQLGTGACDICNSSRGIVANSNGYGPFISSFNNFTTNNGVA